MDVEQGVFVVAVVVLDGRLCWPLPVGAERVGDDETIHELNEITWHHVKIKGQCIMKPQEVSFERLVSQVERR